MTGHVSAIKLDPRIEEGSDNTKGNGNNWIEVLQQEANERVKNFFSKSENSFSFEKLEDIDNEVQSLFGEYNKDKNDLLTLKIFKTSLKNFYNSSFKFLEANSIFIDEYVEKMYGKNQKTKIEHHISSLLALIEGTISFYLENFDSIDISEIESKFDLKILEKEIRALIAIIKTCKSKRGCELLLQFINNNERKYLPLCEDEECKKVEDIMIEFYENYL